MLGPMALLTISFLILTNLFQSVDAIPASDTLVRSEYNVMIKARGMDFNGICIMECNDEGLITGTIVSQMGPKIFDFTMSGRRVRVFNVIEPLDRWFIRRRIRKDLSAILSDPEFSDSVYSLNSRGIDYFFFPLKN